MQSRFFANYGETMTRLIAGLLYLQHALDLSFWVDPITNRKLLRVLKLDIVARKSPCRAFGSRQ